MIDGIVGPWFLAPFRAVAERHDLSVTYVVLRPDLGTTLARALARGQDELTDEEPIAVLHTAFQQLGELEAHAVDTAGLDPVETAAQVRRILAAGALRLR